MVVDAVSDVITHADEQMRPVPSSRQRRLGAPAAIGAVEDRMLILVDIEKLMSSSDMGLVDAAVH